MWSPQRYSSIGKDNGISNEVLQRCIAQSERVIHGDYQLPSLLTLKHFAVRSKVPYKYLRQIVQRAHVENYRKFWILKRSGGRRYIYVPTPALKAAQKWIHEHVLKPVPAHRCSYAFAPRSSILNCATRHCGAKWLIKMDITGFFESVSEIQVFRVFKELGYQPLVAFELARITTVNSELAEARRLDPVWKIKRANEKIESYSQGVMGYLPQGAPTSPLLSNLIMRDLDDQIQKFATMAGLVYTRYSDDLTFSRRDTNFDRQRANLFIKQVSRVLSKSGFRTQHRKTIIVPPSARKIVLGLVVDGDQPRLRREFKDSLRQHLYYLKKFGPIEHATNRHFDSIWGLKSHIRGKIDFAHMIEPSFGERLRVQFEEIFWPV